MIKDRKRYYEEATSWAVETRVRDSRSLRIAWTIVGTLAGVAMLEAVALALLTPLKTVQPITLLVDRQTGFVQALDPRTPRRIDADTALTTSLLAQYVAAREGFNRATIANDYRHVALWSAGSARTQYLSIMPASNPDSPLARYSSGSTVDARVKSVSPLGAGTALVRFDTQLADRAGQTMPVRPWIAVVRYRYNDAPMAFEDRLINPLGFQVTGYRRDAEAPVSATSEASASPADRPAQPSRAPAGAAYRPSYSAYPSATTTITMPSNQVPMGSPLNPDVGRAQPDARSR